MYNTSNTIKVLIGKDVNWDATSIDTMVVGEVTLLGPEDQVLPISSGTATPEYFTILQKSTDGTIHSSQRVKTRNVTKLSKATYTPDAEQVIQVGYEPVAAAGSIEEIDNNLYILDIAFKHDKEMWSEQLLHRIYTYQSGNGATQKAVAQSISKQVNADALGFLSAQLYTTVGVNAALPGVTAALVNGSTTVTSAGHALAVGDVVRFVNNLTTNPIYIVTAINSVNSFEIHTPYQAVSGAAVNAFKVTANTSYGIKITGVATTWKDKGLFKWNKVMWDTSIRNFGTTPYTLLQVADFGEGISYQVRDLEWFSLGGDGALNTTMHPINEGRSDTDLTKTYDVISIEYFNDDDVYPVSGTRPSKGLIYVFRDNTVTDPAWFKLISTGTTNSLEEALEAWTGKTAI